MMIYALNIISHWLVVIAAVTATTLTGYLLNRLRACKSASRRTPAPPRNKKILPNRL